MVLRVRSERDGPRATDRYPVSSKAVALFQSPRRLATVAAVLVAAVMGGATQTMPDGRPTPTGLEVPRWITLKSSQVRARQGPGLDYRILWEYRVAGLPVQVIAETREWRKVCDPQGSVVWIHRTVSSGRRSVFNRSDREVPIHVGKSETSAVRARLSPHALLSLDECEDGWCRVRSGRMRGWIAQSAVFGTQAKALCDAGRPAGVARTGPA